MPKAGGYFLYMLDFKKRHGSNLSMVRNQIILQSLFEKSLWIVDILHCDIKIGFCCRHIMTIVVFFYAGWSLTNGVGFVERKFFWFNFDLNNILLDK